MKLICHVVPITWPYVGAMSLLILAHNSIMFVGALNLKRGKVFFIKKKNRSNFDRDVVPILIIDIIYFWVIFLK